MYIQKSSHTAPRRPISVLPAKRVAVSVVEPFAIQVNQAMVVGSEPSPEWVEKRRGRCRPAVLEQNLDRQNRLGSTQDVDHLRCFRCGRTLKGLHELLQLFFERAIQGAVQL